jgi:hypothetical protein
VECIELASTLSFQSHNSYYFTASHAVDRSSCQESSLTAIASTRTRPHVELMAIVENGHPQCGWPVVDQEVLPDRQLTTIRKPDDWPAFIDAT